MTQHTGGSPSLSAIPASSPSYTHTHSHSHPHWIGHTTHHHQHPRDVDSESVSSRGGSNININISINGNRASQSRSNLNEHKEEDSVTYAKEKEKVSESAKTSSPILPAMNGSEMDDYHTTDVETDMEVEVDVETALNHSTSSTSSDSQSHSQPHPPPQPRLNLNLFDGARWRKWMFANNGNGESSKGWLKRATSASGIDVDLSATPTSIKVARRRLRLPESIRVLIGMMNGAATYTRVAKIALSCVLAVMTLILVIVCFSSYGAHVSSTPQHGGLKQVSTAWWTPMDNTEAGSESESESHPSTPTPEVASPSESSDSNPNPNPTPAASDVPRVRAPTPVDEVNADYVLHPAKYMTRELAEATQPQCHIRYKHLGGILPRPRISEPGRTSLRYFIALNLYNSAGNGVVQSMVDELLRLTYALAERVPTDLNNKNIQHRPFKLVDATDDLNGAVRVSPTNVYISAYESGSKDDTAKYLEELDRRLTEYGVPHHIVVNGSMVQDSVGHRINSLARIRHAPLQPMYDAALRYDDTDGKEGWIVDRVLFINDVFWCAEDAIRLMDEGDGGSEEDMEADAEEERVIQNLPPTPPTTKDGLSSRTSQLVRPSHGSRRGYPDIVCAMDYSGHLLGGIGYYDHWVFRDRGGEHMGQHQFPFFADAYDRAAFREARRMDVSTCWGGMAAIQGDLFYKHRLTLRARTESCAASECAHIAIDTMSAKGSQAWIQHDTMTAVTYEPHHRDPLLLEDWFKVEDRLEHRRRMREKRRKREVSSCVAEDSNQFHCRTCRVATLVPIDHEPLTKPPRSTHATTPFLPINYQSDCPSQHYPISTYVGNKMFYPPPSFCCGEYGQAHYAVNCHHVVTPKWNEDQKQRIWASRFDPFTMVHPHFHWPAEWM